MGTKTGEIGRMLFAAGAIFMGAESIGAEPAALAEIIVTAQKRSENLQEVPMSVVAIDAGTLERAGVMEFVDYASRIPNLSFNHAVSGQFGSQSPAIRGVSGGGTTGFYIDDTPVPESMNPVVNDLERIEVLRGPQGTLYGARSMGGTVRLITKQADPKEFAAAAHATVGFPDHGTTDYSADGFVNEPVGSGTGALRLSGYTRFESGVFDRVPGLQPALPPGVPAPSFPVNHHIDDQHIYGGQLVGAFKMDDGNVVIRPRIQMQRWISDGLPYADVTPGNFTQIRLFDLKEPGHEDWEHYSITVDWHVASGDVVSSTALLRRSSSTSEDYSEFAVYAFGTPPLPALMVAELGFRRFVHETRFASNYAGPLQFTAGIFYSNEWSETNFPNNAIPGINDAAGGAFGTDVVFNQQLHTDVRELAGFGELTYLLTDHLKGVVGARVFDNKVDFTGSQSGFAVAPDTFAGTQQERRVNPKASLEYELSDGANVYASAAQGYRIGGVNSFSNLLCGPDLAAAGLTADQVRTYKSDTLWSYELGLKSRWLDRRVTANAAAFYIDWSNVTQLVPLPTCGFFVFVNAGKAENKGVELEVNAALSEGFTVSAGAGYTDAKITDTGGIQTVHLGALPAIPKWTVSASAEYSFVWGGHPGFARADYNYQSDSLSANNDTVNLRYRPSYSLLNLHTGLTFGHTQFGLFATNLTNQFANYSDIPPVAVELPMRPRIVTNRPRTVGIEARWTF